VKEYFKYMQGMDKIKIKIKILEEIKD